jgi:tetratricopeptide (TPR) repeat protein
VAGVCADLAELYRNQNRYRDAQRNYERALSIYEEKFGPDHAFVANVTNDLAAMYRKTGRHRDLEALLERSLDSAEKVLGRRTRARSRC